MDTNARKNRSGKIMEAIVENQIIQAGFEKDKNYFFSNDNKTNI
ncbi:DpnII family type II restriction endonuclease [Mycoplasma sp. HU2014]